MIKFWVIVVIKSVGRDEASFIHENRVFTDKKEAHKVWDELDQAEFERVELVECGGKTIAEK